MRALLPWSGRGLEIGVGTGRFAAPLGVEFGIGPAAEMLDYARARGVRVARAVAEALPFADRVFDCALAVTAICFVADAAAKQAGNVFYREAHFFSAAEVAALLEANGFHDLIWLQTISAPLSQIREIEPASAGTGRGSFLAVRARVRP